MSDLGLNGATQSEHSDVQPSDSVSQAGSGESLPDYETSNLMHMESFQRAFDRPLLNGLRGPQPHELSPVVMGWLQQVDLNGLESNMVLTLTRTPSTRSAVPVADSWVPNFAPRRLPSIERLPPVFIRSDDTYLFSREADFVEPLVDVMSIVSCSTGAPSTPANQGILASFRARITFGKPRVDETTASSPAQNKRPFKFKLFRGRSSDQLAPSLATDQGTQQPVQGTQQPVQRSQTFWLDVFIPINALRGRNITQTG